MRRHQTIGIALFTASVLSSLATIGIANASTSPITFHERAIDGATVDWIVTKTSDPRVHIQAVVASQRFGKATSLGALAASDHAVAAINGTYFNSPGNLWPDGSLEINGSWQHSDKGSVFAFAPGGKMLIARAYPSAYMAIGTRQVWTWGINTWFTQPTAIAVLTSYYGNTTGITNGTSVVVEHQQVTAIHHGNTPIPRDGYVIEWGDSAYNRNFLTNFVQVGDPVTYTISLDNYAHQKINFPTPIDAISAGPLLVDQGKINLNPALEGFTDPKLVDSDTTRTLIGYTRGNQFVMAVVSAATLTKEATIAKQLGLVAAMNMDGAASSGMDYQGRNIIRPTRALATALTITVQ